MIAPSSLPSKSTWITLLLVLVAAAASGCQWVFGDVEFRPEEGSGGAQGAGGADGSGGAATGGAGQNSCATEGAKRCVTGTGQPQVCRSGAWQNVGSPCSPAELCNATKGECDACFSGDRRCGSNNSTIETCKSNNDGWEVTITCTGSTFCDPGKLSECVVCSLSDTNCKDASTLRTCRNDQTGFVESACVGYPCVTVTDTQAHCGQCDPLLDPPSCSTVGVLMSCSSDAQRVPTACPNGCVMVAGATADYCNP